MTPAEYRQFVTAVCDTHDDETAARLIEARCRPPYRRPRRDVLFPPVSLKAGSEGEAAGQQGGAA